ncbi:MULTISPECIES: hypothetical protein [Actinomycetes]|uniref:hypothetical protein n=1 Tax=Corynebacterium sp. TaxID=1720 RepID=UPI002A91604A|nr:hypothetical protein [Corynebacterium sp.]MDY5786557.1 hypothetical protein [Corynebacterium sp.]
MQPTHAFIDESKNRDYLLITTLMIHSDLLATRKKLRSLLLPGQERFHMKNERDSRRKKLLSLIRDLNATVVIYRAPTSSHRRSQIEARADVLQAFLDDALNTSIRNVCLESDETMNARDRQVIAQFLQRHQAVDGIRYQHLPAKSEILLCIPDAVGWAWNRGGEWKKMVAPLVDEQVV